MSIFNWGEDASEVVDSVGGAVTGTIESINYALSGDLPPDVRLKLEEIKLKMEELQSKTNQGQVELNKKEADSPSFFKSAWRPAIGWIGVVGLFYYFLVHPVLEWYILIEQKTMILVSGEVVPMIAPTLKSDSLMELVFAMLGIGAFRTYEKYKGITK